MFLNILIHFTKYILSLTIKSWNPNDKKLNLLLYEEVTCLLLLSSLFSTSCLFSFPVYHLLAHRPLWLAFINYHQHDSLAFLPYKIKISLKVNQSVSISLRNIKFSWLGFTILTSDNLSCLTLSYFTYKLNHLCPSFINQPTKG